MAVSLMLSEPSAIGLSSLFLQQVHAGTNEEFPPGWSRGSHFFSPVFGSAGFESSPTHHLLGRLASAQARSARNGGLLLHRHRRPFPPIATHDTLSPKLAKSPHTFGLFRTGLKVTAFSSAVAPCPPRNEDLFSSLDPRSRPPSVGVRE